MHGLSIPLGKLGFELPRTLSRGLATPNDEDGTPSFNIGSRVNSFIASRSRSRRNSEDMPSTARPTPTRPVYTIGGSLIPPRPDSKSNLAKSRDDPVLDANASNARPVFEPPTRTSTPVLPSRTIRFPDEEPA